MDKLPIPEILLAGVFSIVFYSWYRSRRSVPLPPGPKGHWLLGNALEIATASSFWMKLSEYADEYGPITSIGKLPQPTFVLSDPHLVTELFEKRAANYSDKDENQMAKLIGWDTDILFTHYGPKLKLYRTMLGQALNNRAALDYLPLQQHEIQKFMQRLIETPSDFMAHVRLLAASIAVRIAYGYKVQSYNDPFVQTAEKHMEGFSVCVQPWNWAVNIFPFLRHLPDWLPIAPFQRRALEARRIFNAHRENPFAYVQDQMAAGTAEDSFTSKLLQTEDGSPVDDETKYHVKSIAATLYAAGSDTTVSAVQSFFLAMALYPEVQAKAQAEISAYFQTQSTDDIPRRMISLEDRRHLPYTSALLHELLRWHPITPIVGHRSSNQDDNNVISGGKTYRIPAKSLVLVNIWKILHNPDVYEQPERFMPERYLVANPPPEPETYAFGFGRRNCPGMHIAQQSMWISVSNLLANFMVSKAKDENGVEIAPKENYSNMIVRDGCKEWLQDAIE
ncbi:hypothetical protein FRC06_010852 [Ceratobasidium sp. 370]|nr:hypothetical protein FRC06_010852 [Ceratobasidium sp. 370]